MDICLALFSIVRSLLICQSTKIHACQRTFWESIEIEINRAKWPKKRLSSIFTLMQIIQINVDVLTIDVYHIGSMPNNRLCVCMSIYGGRERESEAYSINQNVYGLVTNRKDGKVNDQMKVNVRVCVSALVYSGRLDINSRCAPLGTNIINFLTLLRLKSH